MTTQNNKENGGEAFKMEAAMKGGALLGAIVGTVLLPGIGTTACACVGAFIGRHLARTSPSNHPSSE